MLENLKNKHDVMIDGYRECTVDSIKEGDYFVLVSDIHHKRNAVQVMGVWPGCITVKCGDGKKTSGCMGLNFNEVRHIEADDVKNFKVISYWPHGMEDNREFIFCNNLN